MNLPVTRVVEQHPTYLLISEPSVTPGSSLNRSWVGEWRPGSLSILENRKKGGRVVAVVLHHAGAEAERNKIAIGR